MLADVAIVGFPKCLQQLFDLLTMGPSRPRLGLPGHPWASLGLAGPLWARLGLSGPLCASLDLPGLLWASMGIY